MSRKIYFWKLGKKKEDASGDEWNEQMKNAIEDWKTTI